MLLLEILIVGTAGLLTFLGIAIFRAHSLDRQWLDIPNERSSHDRPVPRGAGLVVVPVCLIGYVLTTQISGTHFSWGYLLGAILVALVSWIDDLYSISFIWRLMTHCLAALFILFSEGYWTTFSLGGGVSLAVGWLGPVVTALWIVWVINAYNFMDGIDGIAAVQGLAAAASWALILTLDEPGINLFPMIIFASLCGFIFHNWHPAKAFIGDVGSAFLGFTFASMPLIFSQEDLAVSRLLPLASLLILWPFIFDTVLTLVRRLFRGEMVWQAHRQHLYQLLIICGFSQPMVAITYGGLAVLTGIAAVLIVNGMANPTFVTSSISLASILFAIAVGLIYRRRSRIAGLPNEA